MCILIASTAKGTHPVVPAVNPGEPKVTQAFVSVQKPLMLAENEADTAVEKNQTAPGTTDRAVDPKASSKTDNSEQSAKSGKTPLKPFKPSEEIAAEQAVDFPVDI